MNMTLADAALLAAQINRDPLFEVVAIGRFVMIEDLMQRGDDLPWGVSVLHRDQPETIGRVWSERDWNEFRHAALAPLPKVLTEEQPPASPPPDQRRDTQHRQQLSLF